MTTSILIQILCFHIPPDYICLFLPIVNLISDINLDEIPGARNALNVSRLLGPLFASHGERGWVIVQLIYHNLPAI